MSEILKFIIDNFSKLNALDFVLIVATAVISAFGIFKLVSGLFSKRHEAQNDLLRLKEEAISSYQRQLQIIEGERTRYEEVATQRAKELESLRQHLLASAIQQKFSEQHTNSIVRNTYAFRILLLREQQLISALGVLGSIRTMFAVYVASQAEKRFPDLIKEGVAFTEMEAIDNAILGLCYQVKATIENISHNPSDPIKIEDENIDRDVEALRARMNRLRAAFLEAFRRLLPGIRNDK